MPEALIWGASGGMGQALVSYLKAQGWLVFAAARDERRIPAIADHTYRFKASAPHTIASIAPMIAPLSEGLDLMVYAVGTLRAAVLDDFTEEAWNAVFDSNFHGAQRATQASLPLMKKGAHLVFIGAYVDHLILPKMGAYAAAKAALEPWVSVLRKEQRNVKITLLRPGPVDTPFWANAPFRVPKDARSPEVVAEAIYQRWQSDSSGGDLNL